MAEAPMTEHEATLLAVRAHLAKLFRAIGQPSTCKQCGTPVIWVRHLNGKKAPYTADAENHLAVCRPGG